MRVLVNASQLRYAGGRSVGMSFLSALQGTANAEITAFTPPGCGYESLNGGAIRVETIPDWLNSSGFGPIVDQLWLPLRIRTLDPDVVFSMGNMALPVPQPQLLLFHWSYAVYPESAVWERMSTRDLLWRRTRRLYFRYTLRHASAIIVQTETARDRLRQYYKFKGDVHVVPNAVSVYESEGRRRDYAGEYGLREQADRILLLCLSRYYPHKNMEILVPLARYCKRHELPFTIITTIGEDQHAQASEFIDTIKREELHNWIRNIGPVPRESIASLYEAVDGTILPTLLESYSGTYIESMHFGVPIFTSDLDFAHDVCGDAAFYFDPYEVEHIVEVIEEAFCGDGERERKIEVGYEIARTNPNWQEVSERYLDIMSQLVV